jgi:MFS transporter, Spinster family, sphingosine-1-phosphate transporter
VRPSLWNGSKQPSITQSLLSFMKLPTYWALVAVAVFGSATSYAVLSWMPTFLIRVHGMSTRDVGIQMSGATVLGLLIGNLSTGFVSHWLGAKDVRWLAWVAGAGLLCCVPLGCLSFFSGTSSGSLMFFFFFMVMLGFYVPPLYTMAVGLVDTHSRALVASTMPICFSVGGALGPLFVGFLNDRLTPEYGVAAIRYSMTWSLAGLVLGAAAALVVGRFVKGEYRSGDVALEVPHS